MTTLETLTHLLKNAHEIAIFSHTSPDADALCSSLALRNLINDSFGNKNIDCFVGGEISELYSPILKEEVITTTPLSEYDLAIVLDCPTKQRLGEQQALLAKIPTIINIDHHASNEKFGTLNIISAHATSTCELIALICKKLDWSLSDTSAKQLYQGIITDTNCFTSSTMSRTTHVVLGDLMKFDFDADAIKKYYFNNNSTAKTRMLSFALRYLKFYEQGQLAIMKIPFECFQRYGATIDDTLGIVDNGIAIGSTEICAALIEKAPEDICVSLRSKGKTNAGDVAQVFGGGGSSTIAAFQYNGTLKNCEEEILKIISPFLPDITDSKIIEF